MYDRILFPTDGSAAAENAIEEVLESAIDHDAALYVLHVVDVTSLTLNVRGADDTLDRLEAEGEAIVEEIVESAERAGIETVTGSVVDGAPVEEILDYADENAIDLITMGTHGRSGIERHLIGSVAEEVVRQSTVSVLTMQTSETG